ncbi:LysR family transcriptional regulator [Sporolactobacillus sp. THM7-7]|nr:LysR family transcriptional regulator [Sporolactobacillus sp. THM7-7]
MEIKDLRIFQSVAYQGSVSKAGKELNYVQSYVTARIKFLESTLQTQLFHRYSRGMRLTAEGKKLLTYAENILSMTDHMLEIALDANHPVGKLELGTVETVVRLPMVLSAYHRQFPNVDLSLITGVTEQLANDVLNYKLDGAFVTGFELQTGLAQYEVFREDLVLISSQDINNVQDAIRQPLLVFHSGCRYRRNLENWLHDEGIMTPKVMEFGTFETILGGVISGLGVTLIPQSTIRRLEMEGSVYCFPVPEQYSKITTVFIHRSDTYVTKSMEKFIETIMRFSHLKNTDLAFALEPCVFQTS